MGIARDCQIPAQNCAFFIKSAIFLIASYHGGVMDIRPLIEELGNAIQASVAENPRIVALIEKFRMAGFEASVILEASIFLQPAEKEPLPSSALRVRERVKNGVVLPNAFTAGDNDFLHTLRIGEPVQPDDSQVPEPPH